MSTKVKGDKIKEGSIPLSALDNAVKEEFDYTIPFGGYAGTLEYNNPIQCSSYKIYLVSNTNKIYEITYPQTITLSGNGPSVDVKINTGNGGFIVEALSSAIILYKLKIYNYKKEISSPNPDWNAKQGEAGYIENKPFYTEGDIRQIDVDGEYTIAVGEFNIGDRVYVSWDLEYYDGEVFRGSASFVIEEGGEEPTQYYERDNFHIRGGTYVEMYAYGGGDSLYGKVTVMVNSEIKTLEEKYIPNTVLKTTPQTLSDEDKNQALANLGIPRVINADFYRIEGDMTIDELSEILGDCVTNEILIQGICYRTEHYTVYLPTLHQSYIKDGGGKVLSKLVCGQYRIDEETYDTDLVVSPSIYIQYDEDSQLYTCLLEEY